MPEQQRDIYGNAVGWSPTGRRRRILHFGERRWKCEMRRGDITAWMFCRVHEDCAACAAGLDHDDCPRPTPNARQEPKENG